MQVHEVGEKSERESSGDGDGDRRRGKIAGLRVVGKNKGLGKRERPSVCVHRN